MTASSTNNCPFCNVSGERVIDSNLLAFVIEDAFPVSPGHTLIVSQRHVQSFFDLTGDELEAIMALLHRARTRLESHQRPGGYNIGINIGEEAGQTIMHAHVHLIPRHLGDVPEPKGGVRNVIPGKGAYGRAVKVPGGIVEMPIEISKLHLKAVVNYLTWQHKVELHFHRFMRGVMPMPWDDRFWQLLEHLRELIKGNLERGAGEVILHAAREFFRQAYVTEPPLEPHEYLMEEALQWMQAYESLTRKLDLALADLYEFHGDSFGDLIDSLPLGGRELCERALKTSARSRDGFLDEQEVSEAIKALPPPWSHLVAHENYVNSCLREKAHEYLIAWMRRKLMDHEQSEQIESCSLD
jgi:diadenosine tetraphosphate (Ap4A) HIT family hydrolase